MKSENFLITLIVYVFVAVGIFYLFFGRAHAHDSNHPELNAWYASLYNVKGEWCCTINDTAMTEVRASGDHLEAWIDDRYPSVAQGQYKAGWYPIPADARIVDRENIVGEPVVSFYMGVVRCFLDVARG